LSKKKEWYVYETYMPLNALNGSIIEVACVRITLFKIVKLTDFRVKLTFLY
jgi:hypothetical protein